MTSTLKTFSPLSPYIAGTFSLLFISSVAFSAGHLKSEAAQTEATVITCPETISNLRLNYTTKYTPPTGWSHADARSRQTKGGVISSVTLKRNRHEMIDRNLICRYGIGDANSKINLASVKRSMPKGASCTVENDFIFKCDGMNK